MNENHQISCDDIVKLKSAIEASYKKHGCEKQGKYVALIDNPTRQFVLVTYPESKPQHELDSVGRHVTEVTGLPALVLDDGAVLEVVDVEDSRPADPRLWKSVSKSNQVEVE